MQHLGKIVRILGLALTESAMALSDLFQGIRQKQNIFKEIKFEPTRIWVCVVLRELVRFWVKLDIRNGTPIICANFVGYDEHAHRRGPDSAFTHWSLIGIDGVLRDIEHKARKSKRRHYQVVIYSDHGQEAVVPYQTAFNRSLSAGIRNAFAAGLLSGFEISWTEELLGQIYFFRRGRKLLGTMRTTGKAATRSLRIQCDFWVLNIPIQNKQAMIWYGHGASRAAIYHQEFFPGHSQYSVFYLLYGCTGV